MRDHVKILSWLYILTGLVGLLTACSLLAVFIGAGAITRDGDAKTIFAIMGSVCGLGLAALSLPGLIAGLGLRGYRDWARVLALIVGLLSIPLFPFGTFLGAYTVIGLLDDEANQRFSG